VSDRPVLQIGILIVAYNAETTLENVLTRIPTSFVPQIKALLICDDASSDNTFSIGVQLRKARPDLPIEVIRQPINLGYGGNQKTGYRWMIDNGLDVVVLLHGDGQYAPEFLPQMVAPITSGESDVVFGSRMMTRGAALKGGMPKYKFIGNKILTFWQNTMAQVHLSEWHSGYRAYSIKALSCVNFESNSDYFDFDTEIILQMIETKMRLQEIPIPTFYGDELSRVNGMLYGWRVAKHTTQWRLRRQRQ
jgi:glycosyltransferase involved in cell wall biosynthesis